MKRRIVEHQVLGARLVGTLHDPRGDGAALVDGCFSGKTGLLCLNFGQQPRAWHGDLGARLADATAQAGIPTLRFDMPGLGDVDGTVPTYLEELWLELQRGQHVPVVEPLIDQLRQRYGFARLAISGFCGGAVTAILAARSRRPFVQAVIAFEPELAYTLVALGGDGEAAVEHKREELVRERISVAWQRIRRPEAWRRLLSGGVDLAYYRRLVREAARAGVASARRGKALPADAIADVLETWRELAGKGLPFLVYSVGSAQREAFYRVYEDYTGRGRLPNVTWHALPDTNHTLVIGGAAERILESTPRWILQTLPSAAQGSA